MVKRVLPALVLLAVMALSNASQAQPNRGRYLVQLGGCGDCHTPGYFLGKPDDSRILGGSDVGFGIQGVGIFVGPNLTPDVETGLGRWTVDQIVSGDHHRCPAGRTHSGTDHALAKPGSTDACRCTLDR